MEDTASHIDIKIHHDRKLAIKYDILCKIGEGCFGKIYKAINRSNTLLVALKLQIIDAQDQSPINLAHEIAILYKLKGVQGVPRIYSAGRSEFGNYMEMELLSSTLHDEKSKNYTISEMQVLACDLIRILKRIHMKGFVHQDLKPQNIMRNLQGQLIIIDFGLSALIKHKSAEIDHQKKGFIGTPRYASCAAHEGLPQIPKDDIECLLYVLGFVYKKTMPWLGLKAPANERLYKIYQLKKFRSWDWFSEMGGGFAEAYEYVRQLNR